MKIHKSLKITLYCAVLFLFIGSSIAVAEQIKFEPLNHPINPVHLLPGQIIIPSGRIANTSDLMNMPIIKSGTIKLQNAGIQGIARINAIHDVERSLFDEFNISHDETLSISCNAAGDCSYNVIKLIKTTNTYVEPPAYNNWVEDAKYTYSGNNDILSAQWTVPSSPTNQSGQLIYLFPAMQSYANGTYILQPVLQWGYNGYFGGYYWTLASWYQVGGPYINSTPISAYEGDHISGVIQEDYAHGGVWFIDTYDMTQDTSTSNMVFSAVPYTDNFVALEVYNINTCNQFPGATDFTNLVVDSVIPSWNIEMNQSGCGLSVNRVSPSEVILNTGGPLVNWNYAKVKTITGSTAGAQTNYQMKLTIYNSTGIDTPGNIYLGGNAKSDFSDLRFTKSNGITLLHYWRESYTPGVSAVVWVEVDSIPASPGTTSIYIYYGNPSATSVSSGANTFILFDHFDGSSLNATKWGTLLSPPCCGGTAGSINQSGSVVRLVSPTNAWGQGAMIYSLSSFSTPIAARFRMQMYQGTIRHHVRDGFNNDNTVVNHAVAGVELGEDPDLTTWAEGASPVVNIGTYTIGNYYVVDVMMTSTTVTISAPVPGWSGSNIPIATTGNSLQLTAVGGSGGQATQYVDWVSVRKYVSPEPAWGT